MLKSVPFNRLSAMGAFKSFRQYFEKVDFDPQTKILCSFDYHENLALLLLSNGILVNNRKTLLKFIWPFICFNTTVIGIVMMSLNSYHCIDIKNITDLSESLTYMIIITVALIQLIFFLVKAPTVAMVIKLMDEDFKEMDTAAEHFRATFYKNQLLIWKVNIVWLIFAMTVISAFGSKTIFEIFYQELILGYQEGVEKPFVFKIWLPHVDVFRSPLYEIFLTLDYIALFVVFTTFAFYVSYLAQFTIHSLGQLDLIILAFGELFNFEYYTQRGILLNENAESIVVKMRMHDIIKRHQRIYNFVDKVEEILGPTLLYQMTMSSIALCLTGFQVAEGIENGEFRILFTLLFMACMFQLLIPCILGSSLSSRASMAADACYGCGWESNVSAKCISKEIQIFLLRANRPFLFQAVKFITISLETFTSIISTAGSYFTMLRQVNENV